MTEHSRRQGAETDRQSDCYRFRHRTSEGNKQKGAVAVRGVGSAEEENVRMVPVVMEVRSRMLSQGKVSGKTRDEFMCKGDCQANITEDE
ncbi:hypothetical protein PISMIDRAFT_396942 [Pisolithus microcarpus 441]|uniref:Uncharacterized protein n=1 Tax=Pisolithus microcarpus 441 TaxID=765257 RepID=A0A0C9Z629_9AGAM|nr:hypothetical protein PISMIDRAFT_396942 [Pisolithus microcarpus 441]